METSRGTATIQPKMFGRLQMLPENGNLSGYCDTSLYLFLNFFALFLKMETSRGTATIEIFYYPLILQRLPENGNLSGYCDF